MQTELPARFAVAFGALTGRGQRAFRQAGKFSLILDQ